MLWGGLLMSGMTLQDWINAYIPKEQEKNLMKVNVTQTDTFGGEANYSWANRYEFVINRNASQRNITRKAKALAGMTGVKADTFDYDTGLTIKPRGYNQVIFVDFE
jgi:nitrogen fixation protein